MLTDAWMLEVTRLGEAGGGTRRYYRSNTRVFSYDLPKGTKERLASAQDKTTEELTALIETLAEEHAEEIVAVGRDMKPCEYCETQHYEEFVVRELLNRGLIDLGESGEFADRLSTDP